jgi:adenylosuccinate synthase
VLAVMLLDVLSDLPEIKICTAYEIDGRRVTTFPSHVDDLAVAKPVYETLPGWQADITAVQRYDDLPVNARRYLDRLAAVIGRPVEIVSVGPDREQTMFRGGLVGVGNGEKGTGKAERAVGTGE